ncbi:SDR family oxidoreductase [Yinghuangia seranimata]|uniref:SDR family oxidoreductase n=1 Tax=Yinghuangia seranimata TaxID=408067 RepID=UPI00248C8F9D|nr:SDR family NAD(P)-dependent oxidoreductase [Yinghuangia seranimata]MDI2126317.1 SDR family NAD(P)-dependent oxidoreductase [Yinghuangia seranimata]
MTARHPHRRRDDTVDLELRDRAYYVTGGSRGIGAAVTRLLLAEGAFVAVCGRGGADLDALRAALPADQRGRLLAHKLDVTDAAALSEAVTETATRFGRLDGVVANAGAGAFGSALDTAWPWSRRPPDPPHRYPPARAPRLQAEAL